MPRDRPDEVDGLPGQARHRPCLGMPHQQRPASVHVPEVPIPEMVPVAEWKGSQLLTAALLPPHREVGIGLEPAGVMHRSNEQPLKLTYWTKVLPLLSVTIVDPTHRCVTES
jgi:hypothetical protein